MANFPTHSSTSLVLGAAYGTAAHVGYGVPLPSCLLAGGLCAIAGLLPDVDSDNAIIFREVLTFAAVFTPMLLLDRFRSLGWDQESIVVAAGLLYVIIRFGLGEIIRRTTVHRGMWHSIPAAAVATLVIYFACACPDVKIRLFKASAVAVGFLWHLILDEIYAIERGAITVRRKKSFGTAFKFVGKDIAGNVMVYGLLAGITTAIFMIPPEARVIYGEYYANEPTGGQTYPNAQTQLTPVPASESGSFWKNLFPSFSSQQQPQAQPPQAQQPAYPQQPPYAQPYPQPSYVPPNQGAAPSASSGGSWDWHR